MKNFSIESFDEAHGGEIIKFFQSIGINTRDYNGSATKERGSEYRFYGVMNGVFSNRPFIIANTGGVIVTLEEARNYFCKTQQQEEVKLENTMKVVKTQTLQINGKDREVTVVVITAGDTVRVGYSVRMPEDKPNPELAEKIALGRALKDKTNLAEDMYMHDSMKQKYILYAIAEHYLKVLSDGKIIKGVK